MTGVFWLFDTKKRRSAGLNVCSTAGYYEQYVFFFLYFSYVLFVKLYQLPYINIWSFYEYLVCTSLLAVDRITSQLFWLTYIVKYTHHLGPFRPHPPRCMQK